MAGGNYGIFKSGKVEIYQNGRMVSSMPVSSNTLDASLSPDGTKLLVLRPGSIEIYQVSSSGATGGTSQRISVDSNTRTARFCDSAGTVIIATTPTKTSEIISGRLSRSW